MRTSCPPKGSYGDRSASRDSVASMGAFMGSPHYRLPTVAGEFTWLPESQGCTYDRRFRTIQARLKDLEALPRQSQVAVSRRTGPSKPAPHKPVNGLQVDGGAPCGTCGGVNSSRFLAARRRHGR
jgi:hypothetical protein